MVEVGVVCGQALREAEFGLKGAATRCVSDEWKEAALVTTQHIAVQFAIPTHRLLAGDYLCN